MAGIKATVDALLDIQKQSKENLNTSKAISLLDTYHRDAFTGKSIQQRAREIQEAEQRARQQWAAETQQAMELLHQNTGTINGSTTSLVGGTGKQ